MNIEDLVIRLETEIKACRKYMKKAIQFAKERKIYTAWDMLEISETAFKCANQVHEEIWEFSKGELSGKALEVFIESETLITEFRKAYKILKAESEK